MYLLWFKGKHDTYLFGVYSTMEKATDAETLYKSSGKCKEGYFQPVQVVEIDKHLSSGYLPDGIKR